MPRPKIHSRNSVFLFSSEKREWKNILTADVAVDDVVRDVGKVQAVNRDAYRSVVEVISNDVFYFSMSDTVYAFVKVTN